MKEKWMRPLFLVSFTIVMLLLPFVLEEYYLILIIESILLGIFAMSFDLLMGYGGLVSFGHAVFFGTGAYALAYALLRWETSVWVALGFASIVALALSIVIGFLSILTLAFAELIYRIVFYSDSLGGSDGLIGLPKPILPFPGGIRLSIASPFYFYFFACAYGLMAYGAIWKVTHSPFGKVLEAIRENEERASFVGHNVKMYKMICLGCSAVFAALSGAMYSLFKGFADTEQLHSLLSGKVIMMTLLGGIRTLLGPIVGAAFLTFSDALISRYFEYYLILIGVSFVAVVIFLPKGFFGPLRDYLMGKEKET
jgi:branched-chain amino acid transport system permease protein